MKTTYNKSEIMKRAHQLKRIMGYDTFSQALKHSWLVANEVREREQDAKNAAIRAMWAAQHDAKRKAEVEAENARIAASGMDIHTYRMTEYYANNAYTGD